MYNLSAQIQIGGGLTMDTLLVKLILKKEVTEADIENALSEICDMVHSSCDSSCPVFAINKAVPDGDDCRCFKNCRRMRKYIEAFGI